MSLRVFAWARVEEVGTKGRSEHAKSIFFPENSHNCSNKQAACDVMCKEGDSFIRTIRMLYKINRKSNKGTHPSTTIQHG